MELGIKAGTTFRIKEVKCIIKVLYLIFLIVKGGEANLMAYRLTTYKANCLRI